MDSVGKVLNAMIAYFGRDVKRINHFLKVYGFARAIAESEGLAGRALETIELAALTHDIGIKNSEEKYHSAAGNFQQLEGPPEAEKLLAPLGIDPEIAGRVCFLNNTFLFLNTKYEGRQYWAFSAG